MNKQHKATRAKLRSMAPKRAVAYIESFDLPEDEKSCLIECDIRKKSYPQASESLHLSPEAIKKRRRSAFAKIADHQNNF